MSFTVDIMLDAFKWEPSEHPRAQSGEKGGQFVKKGTATGGPKVTPPATRTTGQPRNKVPVGPAVVGILHDWAWTSKYKKLSKDKTFAKFLREKLPQFQGTVYRGETVSPEDVQHLQPGKRIRLKENTSGSTDHGPASAVTVGSDTTPKGHVPVMFHIANAQGADLASIVASPKDHESAESMMETYQHNGEVILPMGEEYEIVKREKANVAADFGDDTPGYNVYLRRVAPDDAKPASALPVPAKPDPVKRVIAEVGKRRKQKG